PAGDITVSKGVVSHAGSKKSATFGELARRAGRLSPPAEVTLKDPKDFTLIGTELPRKDNEDKTTGKGMFTLDVQLPGMVYAAIAHPPRFGGKVKSYSHRVAAGMKGVRSIITIPSGLAVVAD